MHKSVFELAVPSDFTTDIDNVCHKSVHRPIFGDPLRQFGGQFTKQKTQPASSLAYKGAINRKEMIV